MALGDGYVVIYLADEEEGLGLTLCFGPCVMCGYPFFFFSDYVPAILMHLKTEYPADLCPCSVTGEEGECLRETARLPVCDGCIEKSNETRERLGLPLWSPGYGRMAP